MNYSRKKLKFAASECFLTLAFKKLKGMLLLHDKHN